MSISMRTTVYGIKKKFPSVHNVTCPELDKWRKSKGRSLLVLDTRPVAEYQVSHLPGSVRIDPEGDCDLSSLGISLAEKNTVVCYCSVGYRSSKVAQKLLEPHTQGDNSGDHTLPPLDVFNLEGGLFQWACEGREMTNEGGESISTVHPYSSLWGKLLPSNLRPTPAMGGGTRGDDGEASWDMRYDTVGINLVVEVPLGICSIMTQWIILLFKGLLLQ